MSLPWRPFWCSNLIAPPFRRRTPFSYRFLPIRPYIVEALEPRFNVSPSLKPSGPSPITFLAFPVEMAQWLATTNLPMRRKLTGLTHLIQEAVRCHKWSPRNLLVNDRSRA